MKAKINVKSIRYRPSEDSLAARIDVVDENSTYSYAGKLTVTTKHFDESDIYELRDSKWVIPKDINKTHSDAVYEAIPIKDLQKVLDGKIAKNSVFVTDSLRPYQKLSLDMDLNHIRIATNKRSKTSVARAC